MKNYNQFINNNDKLNEEFIKKFFTKMWDKLGKLVGNIPGGKEVEKIYNEYKKKLETELQRIAGVDLQAASAKKENLLLKYTSFINEAQDVDVDVDVDDKKLTRESLIEKSKILKKKLDLLLKEATTKMEKVLKDKGGAEKNPKLKELIELKKDTLNIDYLNMKLAYVEKSGNKELIKEVEQERKKTNKMIEDRFKKIQAMDDEKSEDKDVEGEFKIGNRYRYNDDGKIKTVEISGDSDKKGELKGFFVDDKSEQEKDIIVKNIVTDFDVNVGDKFSYYSKSNDEWIDVEIVEVDGINLKVQGEGDPFKITKNTLGPRKSK